MGKDVVTSVRVDRDLWRKVRIYALENDLSLKELVEALLKAELREKRLLRGEA